MSPARGGATRGGADRHRRLRGRATAAAVLLLGAAALAVLRGFWYEPRWMMQRHEVALGLDTAPFRMVHLSDLHHRRETPATRKLLAGVAAARPDLIVITGDLIAGGDSLGGALPGLRATAALLGELRRAAPVVGVQGHSEFLGPIIAYLGEAGVEWLSNEGRLYGGDPATGEGGFLLLGLNQQAGHDLFPPAVAERFEPLTVDGAPAWGRGAPSENNHHFHFDPAPASLADASGPLAWSGYELTCEVRIEDPEAEVGVSVHSRYPLGEDRMLRLRRPGGKFTRGATFQILTHGTGGSSGQGDTGVVPQPGLWYRLRVRTEVEPEAVRLLARVWPVGEPEPESWQAHFEDRTATRVEAGTVGLWTRGGGAAFRALTVRANTGEPLLDEPFASRSRPTGWRDGTRGSRLAMALARSPHDPGAELLPRVVLSHVPTVAPEAARRGLEAVLSGHTHGGQVRLPGLALLTRTPLGPHFDRGVFDFAAPNRTGWTRLYINAGVGTSLLPVRFLSPPSFTVVEVGRRRASGAP